MTKQIASHLRKAFNTARFIYHRAGHAVVFAVKKSSKVLSLVYRSSKLHIVFSKLSPLITRLYRLVKPILSSTKQLLSNLAQSLRPITRKLSPLPHLALIAAILTPLLSTIILEIHSSRLYKVVETEQLLLSKTSVKKDLIKDTDGAFTTIIGNSIKSYLICSTHEV